jgi:hypothetical protein
MRVSAPRSSSNSPAWAFAATDRPAATVDLGARTRPGLRSDLVACAAAARSAAGTARRHPRRCPVPRCRRRQGVSPTGTAVEAVDECFEHAPVEPVEAEPRRRRTRPARRGRLQVDRAVALDVGVVTDASQQPVGDTRGPARPAGDLRAPSSVTRCRAAAPNDARSLELVDLVVLEVCREPEAVAQRCRDQPGAGRRADQGERGRSNRIERAPGPLPTTMSSLKSSIAGYRTSSTVRGSRWTSSTNSTSPGCRPVRIAARSPGVRSPDPTSHGTARRPRWRRSPRASSCRVPAHPTAARDRRAPTLARSGEHELELAPHPLLADELVERRRTQARLDVGPRRAACDVDRVHSSSTLGSDTSSLIGPPRTGSQPTHARSRSSVVPHAVVVRLRQRATSTRSSRARAVPHGPRQPTVVSGRARCARRGGASHLGTLPTGPQFEHEAFGDLLADARNAVSATTSPVAIAARSTSAQRAQRGQRQPRPHTRRGEQQIEHRERARSVNPYSVIESSRTCSEVCSSTTCRGGIVADAPRARGSRHPARRPRHGPGHADDRPRSWAITVAPPRVRAAGSRPASTASHPPPAARARRDAPARAAGPPGCPRRVSHAVPRQVGQGDRDGVGDVGGRRRVRQTQLCRDHAADRRLVRGAAAGDRSLTSVGL